jgi:Icc-related predicted phosphoesterase
MSLARIRVIQVGDLHLPLTASERTNLDDKDSAFPTQIKKAISASPTKTVYKKLYELIQSGEYDTVLFMGDLTDKGHLKSYSGAVNFLAQSLQIGKGRKNASQKVGFVPGNHDINRELSSRPDLREKFAPLNESLNSAGLPPLPVFNEVELFVSQGPASAKIILMNSCWGCGAREFIPEMFRETIADAINKIMGSGGVKELSQYYNRQLDTPAFSNESVTRIYQSRQSTPEDTLEVYVAHHNLLPQRLTRLAPYTELVNSGAMRATLTSGSKPTIYLHGHIHEDPVEIVRTPSGANLISVAAPMSSDGFNIIEFVFTESGLPLACMITPWRFNPAGIFGSSSPILTSLLSGRRRSRSPSVPNLLIFILERQSVFWSDIESHPRPFYENQTEALLLEGIETLKADDLIVIDNYTMSPKNWIVRSNI